MLELIDTAQKAGFSLDEIRALVPNDLEQWDHGSLIPILRRKVEEIEALEARLTQSKTGLLALIADIEAKPDDLDCAANARRVLSRMLAGDMRIPAMAASDVKRLGQAGGI